MAKTYYDSAYTGPEIDAAVSVGATIAAAAIPENRGKFVGFAEDGSVQAVDLGRVAVVARGAYDPAAEYERLDAVSYNGSSYLVRKHCQGVEPAEGEYYMLLAKRGDDGLRGPQGEIGPQGPQGPQGPAGDNTAALEAAQSANTAADAANSAAAAAREVADTVMPDVQQLKDDLAAEVKRATEAEDNRIKKFYTGNLGAVSIADSDDGAVRNLVIGGKCEQLQTAGINLYHNFKTGQEKEASGIKFTAVENDGISVVGTSVTTANSSGAITPYLSNLSDGKRYTCRTFCDDVKGAFIIKKADGSTSYVSKFVYDSGEIVSVYPYFEVIGGVTIDTVIYPMVCEEAYVSQPYEPYTGGAPSPSPEYPQEIRSVENCTVTISNADGTETQTAPIPVTLRGIGDVRDELYVYEDGSGKLVQRIGNVTLDASADEYWQRTTSDGTFRTKLDDAKGENQQYEIICNRYSYMRNPEKYSNCARNRYGNNVNMEFFDSDYDNLTLDDFKARISENPIFCHYVLGTPSEIPLSAEQVKALFELRTYYGGTNVTFQSDNGVEPVVNFDYACALDNFVEYIKAAQGDDRKFIYDMDERMTDAEYVAALAYVNSEYAAALTELEV